MNIVHAHPGGVGDVGGSYSQSLSSKPHDQRVAAMTCHIHLDFFCERNWISLGL